MIAEVVSVGTELLLGDIVDSNAARIGQVLADGGIQHLYRQTVGDNLERLTQSLKQALGRSDIVFTIGGLGPTEDDLTREGIAAALKDELIHDPKIEAHLRKLFIDKGIPWDDSQLRQAKRPSSAIPIDNPNGSAAGLICRKNGKVVIAMPGPPLEFMPMLEGPVKHFLSQLGNKGVIYSRTLRVCGIGEGRVEELVRDLIHTTNPTIAPYAKTGEVHLRITAKAENIESAKKLVDPVEKDIRTILGRHVYGIDKISLEESVLSLLKSRNSTIAVAESCTGGGLGERITGVPGSSSIFLGGVIAYANEVKTQLLNVKEETIKKYGAVSKECAGEMALGVCRLFHSTYGVSITGIAGAGGEANNKPIGLVYIGVAEGDRAKVNRYTFFGSRERIRAWSVQYALIDLWEMILGVSEN